MKRHLLGVVLVAAVGLGTRAADEPPTQAEIGKLISQLGSADFAEREAAAKRLEKLPTALLPLREAAKGSDNAEVRTRAAALLKTVAPAAGREHFKQQKEKKYAEQRQVDRLIESLVAWREGIGDDERKLVRAFAEDVLAQVKKEFGPDIPKVEIPGLFQDTRPPEKWPLVVGDRVEHPPFPGADVFTEYLPKIGRGPVTVSRDGAETENGPGGRLSLMNGSYRHVPPAPGLSPTSKSLIICNGDFTGTAQLPFENGILICTGKVTLASLIDGSLIIAGGEVAVDPGFVKGLQRAARVFPKGKKLNTLLNFYDAAAEGLHVGVADKTLTVTKVDAGKPFALAGLQPGDRILRVNNQPVADLPTLNKYLCRAEVGPTGTAVIAVQRNEKAVEVTVKLAR